MKVCVLGAGGLLGHMLIRTLSVSNDVFGTTREEPNDSSPLAKFLPEKKWISQIDAKNSDSVKKIFDTDQFDVAINCIGLIKQKYSIVSDKEMMSINGDFPHLLAQIANSNGTRVAMLRQVFLR